MQDKEFQNLDRRLRETRQLAEENHELLEKIHRSIVWGRVFRIMYWVILIGIAIGAFYFLEPYWDSVRGIYEGGLQNFSSFQG